MSQWNFTVACRAGKHRSVARRHELTRFDFLHAGRQRGSGGLSQRDDGTVAPTSAIGSLPFAPDVIFPAMVAMRERNDRYLSGEYSFHDGFNANVTMFITPQIGKSRPSLCSVASDHPDTDQGQSSR